jgi:hypothetical protein
MTEYGAMNFDPFVAHAAARAGGYIGRGCAVGLGWIALVCYAAACCARPSSDSDPLQGQPASRRHKEDWEDIGSRDRGAIALEGHGACNRRQGRAKATVPPCSTKVSVAVPSVHPAVAVPCGQTGWRTARDSLPPR